MRLRVQDIGLLDLTKATDETLNGIESIRDVGLVLVEAGKSALLQQISISDVGNVQTIPEGATLFQVNGTHQVTANAPDTASVYLCVNGKLVVQPDVSADQLRRQLIGGLVNGKVVCTKAQLAVLTSLGLRVNGKLDAYPEGCQYRDGNAPLTCNEAALAEKDLYLAERVTAEAGSLALLRQAGRKLFGDRGIVVQESDREDLRAVWHGTGEMVVVPEGFRFVNKSLDVSAATNYQLRGKRFVHGSLTLQASVEPHHLEALEAIHVTEKVTLPIALLDAFLPKLVNEPEILPYEGRLVVNGVELMLTEAMLTQSDQPLTLLNKAAMTVEKTVSPALLREKVALLINCASLKLTREQQGALFDRLENNAYVDTEDAEAACEPAEEPIPEDVRVIRDTGYLML